MQASKLSAEFCLALNLGSLKLQLLIHSCLLYQRECRKFPVLLDLLSVLMPGLSINSVWLHLHSLTDDSIYLDVLSSSITLYDKLTSQKHFSQCVQLSLYKWLICNFMSSWVYFHINPLYYIAFGSKYISVRDSQKHLSPHETFYKTW